MDTFLLTEHQTSDPLALTPDDVAALLRLPGQPVRLQPAPTGWHLITGARVGSARLPSGRRLVIRPKVPTENLLWMLASQYDLAHWNGWEQLAPDSATEVADLYVFVLLEWVNRLHKRGMFQAYITLDEELPGVKGRYNVSRNPAERSRFRCEFDEHSPDTALNRIIRSTLRLALSLPLESKLLQRVRGSYRRLSGVGEVTLSEAVFRQFTFNRLNRHYRPLISLCQLLYRRGSLNERDGQSAFDGFFVDMNRLFEDFIRNALKKLLPSQHIHKSVRSNWAVAVQVENHLPALKPDIVIEGKMLLDAKYYASPLKNGVLHSSHLYQLATYCRAYGLDGLLVYPESGTVFREFYDFDGRILGIQTVNLSGSRQALHQSLQQLRATICEATGQAESENRQDFNPS